jgi:hypothetical protein
MYASTTDPSAWEFRHPLFRRGEQHLLASIKRKPTRPTALSDAPPLSSPTDEYDPRHAGWLGSSRPAYSNLPIPLIMDRGLEPAGYDWNVKTGEALTARIPGDRSPMLSMDDRDGLSIPASMAVSTGSSRATLPPDNSLNFRPPSSRPAVSLPYIRSSYRSRSSDDHANPNHQAHLLPNSIDERLGRLEEKVQRLNQAITMDRRDQVRGDLSFSIHLLQMTGWLASGNRES